MLGDIVTISYGKGQSNPVDSVRFYSREDACGVVLNRDKVSSLLPSCSQEKYVRVYCRDVGLLDAARFGFEQWCGDGTVCVSLCGCMEVQGECVVQVPSARETSTVAVSQPHEATAVVTVLTVAVVTDAAVTRMKTTGAQGNAIACCCCVEYEPWVNVSTSVRFVPSFFGVELCAPRALSWSNLFSVAMLGVETSTSQGLLQLWGLRCCVAVLALFSCVCRSLERRLLCRLRCVSVGQFCMLYDMECDFGQFGRGGRDCDGRSSSNRVLPLWLPAFVRVFVCCVFGLVAIRFRHVII